MCVIMIKKKGVSMPMNETIKSMWDTNSDGAGFMFALDNKVFIQKGFMKLTELTKAILLLEKGLLKKGTNIKDVPLVMHFRITTHGGTSAANTHPFAITNNEKLLVEKEVTTDLGLAHNGIINSVTSALNLSDTMVYITDVLSPLKMLNADFYKTTFGKELMENTIGFSKFAFLDKEGAIELVGEFKNGTKAETKDLLFSNLLHEYPATTYYKSNYNTSDYYYDNFDYNYTDDYLKPITKDEKVFLAPISVIKDNAVIVEELLEVKTDDLWFMDMDGEIYIKTKNKDKEVFYLQSKKFARAVNYDKKEKMVYILTWDDLKTKDAFVGKVEYDYTWKVK